MSPPPISSLSDTRGKLVYIIMMDTRVCCGIEGCKMYPNHEDISGAMTSTRDARDGFDQNLSVDDVARRLSVACGEISTCIWTQQLDTSIALPESA